MDRNTECTVYIGNLDEKVSEKVLYEILIQAGRLVDFNMPQDKETNRHKGYAFAEYETEEIADYAVRLFEGLVTLHGKLLKFQMSGRKSMRNTSSQNQAVPVAVKSDAGTPPKSQRAHMSRQRSPRSKSSPNRSMPFPVKSDAGSSIKSRRALTPPSPKRPRNQ